MKTKQLLGILKYIPGFVGVFPCDLLPISVPLVAGIVINTDHSLGPGAHWVAVYIKNGQGEYFDSYGRIPQIEITRFLDNVCYAGWRYSDPSLQSIFSKVCGNYCLMFLIFRLLNFSYHDFINMFSTHEDLNDYLVHYLTTRSKKN